MARLQILELPEGASDARAPFVLVVDETMPQRVIIGMDHGAVRDYWHDVADRIGARGVIVTAETVEIPANDVTLPEPVELVAEAELRYDLDETRRNYEGACKTVADMHAAATGREGIGPVRGVVEDVEDVRRRAEDAERKLSESETLGHRLLQRAEVAEAVTAQTKGLMERRTRTLRERAEAAEAGRVAADNMLRAICEVFGGPHQDPVVKARETLARAEQAELKVKQFAEAQQQELVDRMDDLTEALGIDRLRDWGAIIEAAKSMRMDGASGHSFGGDKYDDPLRCSKCGIERVEWVTRRDVPSCATVLLHRGLI